MTAVKTGDTVHVHYTGRLDDGSVFDSSSDRQPLEFTIGAGSVIPGFEQAVLGMSPGDTKTVTIASGDAYGPHHAEMVHQVSRSQLPPDLEVEVGTMLRASGPNGEDVPLTVVDVSDQSITVDANHPLAGKDLTFELELVAIG